MSEVVILNYKDPRTQSGDFRSQVDAIFFETSTKKDFETQKQREEFNWKYLGFYLSHYPEYAWLALKAETVLGYVVGMPFSHDPSLYQIQPHIKAFKIFFEKYPAHLHINCLPEAQGKGIGKRLVQALTEQMMAQRVPGIHILTGPDSVNRLFYQKLGFHEEVEQSQILLMARALDT